VVNAKDSLVNHLRDIKKLLHRGDAEKQNSDVELSDGNESSDAEDDAALNRKIAHLNKAISD